MNARTEKNTLEFEEEKQNLPPIAPKPNNFPLTKKNTDSAAKSDGGSGRHSPQSQIHESLMVLVKAYGSGEFKLKRVQDRIDQENRSKGSTPNQKKKQESVQLGSTSGNPSSQDQSRIKGELLTEFRETYGSGKLKLRPAQDRIDQENRSKGGAPNQKKRQESVRAGSGEVLEKPLSQGADLPSIPQQRPSTQPSDLKNLLLATTPEVPFPEPPRQSTTPLEFGIPDSVTPVTKDERTRGEKKEESIQPKKEDIVSSALMRKISGVNLDFFDKFYRKGSQDDKEEDDGNCWDDTYSRNQGSDLLETENQDPSERAIRSVRKLSFLAVLKEPNSSAARIEEFVPKIESPVDKDKTQSEYELKVEAPRAIGNAMQEFLGKSISARRTATVGECEEDY